MIASYRPPRPLIAGAAILLAAVVCVAATLAMSAGRDRPPASAYPSRSVAYSPSASAVVAATATPVRTGYPSGFVPIDLFAEAPFQWLAPTDAPGDSIWRNDPGRPIPAQSRDWLELKAAGRVVLADGRIDVLAEGVDPLADPRTGALLPQARMLDLSWTRWIVEPTGDGSDAAGNTFTNRSYWNLCGPGAVAGALYYWQQLTGFPDVTGTAGYFLDPYESAGAEWPARGPVFISPSGEAHRRGTYWAGSDTVSGFTAHGRGFLMYLAMAARPAGWTATGIDIFVDGDGVARYPTLGAPPRYMMSGLNWEASNHHPTDWQETYYTIVSRWNPTMARDLRAAVMIDIGRDGVPIVASADTFYLPNWQAADPAQTPHTRHAIAIVGYDNTTNPPTYTYLDTCGRRCNARGGNRNGQIHVVSQERMVEAMTASYGMGFIW